MRKDRECKLPHNGRKRALAACFHKAAHPRLEAFRVSSALVKPEAIATGILVLRQPDSIIRLP